MIVFIKEKSWLAKKAAQKLHSPAAAIVMRKTIHLWGVTRKEFLQSPLWVRHEVAHVYQYKKYGLVRFLFLYLTDYARVGYYKNRFEQEARSKENEVKILDGITFR